MEYALSGITKLGKGSYKIRGYLDGCGEGKGRDGAASMVCMDCWKHVGMEMAGLV